MARLAFFGLPKYAQRREPKTPHSLYDSQIAATAAVNGRVLLTRNVVDFAGFGDLRAENCFEEKSADIRQNTRVRHSALEIPVQDEPLRARYVLLPAHIPDDLFFDRITVNQLPPDWRRPGARGKLQKRGAD